MRNYVDDQEMSKIIKYMGSIGYQFDYLIFTANNLKRVDNFGMVNV